MLLSFFKNDASLLALLFLILQQAVAASSTYWIAQLGSSVAAGGNVGWPLLFFVLSLTLVYVPGTLYAYFVQAGRIRAYAGFVDAFVRRFHGRTSLWRDREFREKHRPILTQEAYVVLRDVYPVVFDGIALVLNVVLNVAMLVVVLDKSVIVVYVVSFVVLGAGLLLFDKRIARAASASQEARIQTQDALSRGWDNILLGNQRPAALWSAHWQTKVESYRSAVLKGTLTNVVLSNGIMLAGLLPVAGWLLLTYLGPGVGLAAWVAIAVTLPRQVQVVQNLQALVGYLVEARSTVERVKVLAETLRHEGRGTALTDWPRLRFFKGETTVPTSGIDDLETKIRTEPPCRLMVRGPNGAGKTTLLLELKERLGASAFYLPPSSDLQFRESPSAGSLGEQSRQALESLSEGIAEGTALLLDEWDAHLDPEQTAVFDRLIEQWSERVWILESRH